MEIYIARQPIFDRRQKLYGYELLYRSSSENKYTGVDDDQATAELIYNSFMVVGLNDLTDGAFAFINFSKDLIDSDVPLILPKSNVYLEILERKEVTEATVSACKTLQEMGYKLALDDFTITDNNLSLIEYADIIKVEFSAVSIDEQKKLIKKYGSKKKFLAERIETREDYKLAFNMGYDFFQGYFFSKPLIIKHKEIESLNINIFRIIEELIKVDPSFDVISEIVEGDLGLSVKLLKLVNSFYYGSRNKIKTIPHALIYLGIKELYQWFSLIMLKDIQNVENSEVIKLSMIRGKMMELVAVELCDYINRANYFFTGMFSFLDILLDKPMKQILESLPLSEEVKQALLGGENEYSKVLDFVKASESASWNPQDNQQFQLDISTETYMRLYMEALKWAKKLNY
jgi:EAL and modified HD-GYP domain-containing signal transduction protein